MREPSCRKRSTLVLLSSACAVAHCALGQLAQEGAGRDERAVGVERCAHHLLAERRLLREELLAAEQVDAVAVLAEQIRVPISRRPAPRAQIHLQPAAALVAAFDRLLLDDRVVTRAGGMAKLSHDRHRPAKRLFPAGAAEPPHPGEERGVEAPGNVERAPRIHHPFQCLADQPRTRQRGMSERQDAGVAGGSAGEQIPVVDHRDPLSSLGQVVRRADADDAASHDDGVTIVFGHGG